jgi:hypothetical protein
MPRISFSFERKAQPSFLRVLYGHPTILGKPAELFSVFRTEHCNKFERTEEEPEPDQLPVFDFNSDDCLKRTMLFHPSFLSPIFRIMMMT